MNDSEFYIQIDSDNDLDNDEFYNNSLRSPLSTKNLLSLKLIEM